MPDQYNPYDTLLLIALNLLALLKNSRNLSGDHINKMATLEQEIANLLQMKELYNQPVNRVATQQIDLTPTLTVTPIKKIDASQQRELVNKAFNLKDWKRLEDHIAEDDKATRAFAFDKNGNRYNINQDPNIWNASNRKAQYDPDGNLVRKEQLFSDNPKVRDKLLDATSQFLSKTADPAMDAIYQYLERDINKSDTELKVEMGLDTAAEIAGNFGPYGKMVETGYKLFKVAKGVADQIWGYETQDFSYNPTLTENVNGSYIGVNSDLADAESKADKKWSKFSPNQGRRADDAINKAKSMWGDLQTISNNAADWDALSNQMSDINHLRNEYKKIGGYNQAYNRAAKEGMKIEKIDVTKEPWAPQIHIKLDVECKKEGGLIQEIWSPIISTEIKELKKGGNINKEIKDTLEVESNQPNLIPEGALHKNKHHLEDTGFDDKGITKKGIPVIDNEGNQQAEIEHSEIIFNLEVTKKLEELYHEFYNSDTTKKRLEELALIAGRLLHELILFNTDDRTNLIESCKEGGVLKALNGTKTPRTMDLLVEYAKEKNPRFILRMSEPVRSIILPDGKEGTHFLSYSESDNKWDVYPLIYENENGDLVFEPDYLKAWSLARKNNNVLTFDTEEEAKMFTELYKKYWPEFFSKFEDGGLFEAPLDGYVPWNSKKSHVIERLNGLALTYTASQYNTAKGIWDYCTGTLKWTPNQTAAIMGSIMQESSLNRGAKLPNGDYATGWFQMHSDALKDYNTWLKAHPKHDYSEFEYINSILSDTKSPYYSKDVWHNPNSTIDLLSRWFTTSYEKAGTPEHSKRILYANHFYKWFTDPPKKKLGGKLSQEDINKIAIALSNLMIQ